MCYQLIDEFEVSAPVEEVWRLLCTPENLPGLTPEWMRFRVVSPSPVAVFEGAVIDYRMAWRGVPMRWRSLITEHQLHQRLAYLQLVGPYAMWLHQHRFEVTESGGTRVLDCCTYSLPLGPLGHVVHRVSVRHQVLDIFRHRRRRLREKLGRIKSLAGPRIRRM